MTSQYIYLIIFFCLGYLIVTDESIAKAVVFVSRIAKTKFEIFRWWLIHNPKMPWARYSMHRRSMKLAEELMKEFENKND
jgi:Fe-S oxidoreductase